MEIGRKHYDAPASLVQGRITKAFGRAVPRLLRAKALIVLHFLNANRCLLQCETDSRNGRCVWGDGFVWVGGLAVQHPTDIAHFPAPRAAFCVAQRAGTHEQDADVAGQSRGLGRAMVGCWFSLLISPCRQQPTQDRCSPLMLSWALSPHCLKAEYAFEVCLFSSFIQLLFSSPARHVHLCFAQKED